jgi:pyruvate dehydrogenase E2 component (dihydrolipoamide acetyltransferase)
MATPVIMPKQGQSVESCIITKWFRQKGETVKAGDILFSYETDKAAFDLEAPSDGVLLDIFFEEGAEVPVLMNVAVIGAAGESYSAISPEKTMEVTPVKEVLQSSDKNPEPQGEVNPPSQTGSGKIRISPRAKRLAQNNNVAFTGITGTGPNGRIISRDIEKTLSGQTGAAGGLSAGSEEYTELPLSNVRKLIAKAMHSSLQNTAQLTHHMSADVRNILEARKKIKEQIAKDPGVQDITLNDMICWCIIRALQKFPEANSHFLDDRIRTFSGVNMGIAVDTQRGLMVPSVKNSDRMDLSALSRALKSVTIACRQGNIDPELIKSSSASFTVSNLGNYGVEMFTPVINIPQVAILGVCTIINRPADLGNNTFGFIPVMGLSLTYDHRAIDGGPATLFLREIKDQIEKFRY